MSRDWVGMILRGVRKPPKVILRRIGDEVRAELERFIAPARARYVTGSYLVKQFGGADIDSLWEHLASTPYLAATESVEPSHYEQVCPGDAERILSQAAKALNSEVDLLGSGPIQLGEPIAWNRDYKSGFHWDNAYIRSIEYNNPERPSDVKFPWELSRLQWLIPVGQAYLLSGDERYARAVRDLLLDWIVKNPYAHSVNWACTMEVALRILSWSWLFHIFKASDAWREHGFRERFLTAFYLHADFTSRHLERSDINGNHYTADAAGLVFAGLFFSGCERSAAWLTTGWNILTDELPLQVSSDGVDFEGSVPYHRLVQELFFLPAFYRERCNLETPEFYRQRVTAMARFTLAYTQPDGNAPLIGDADDARSLPFGGQDINDHRYLPGIVGCHWGDSGLKQSFSGSKSELYWLLGSEAVASLPDCKLPLPAESVPFHEGGYYILGDGDNHLFVDCAPLGLAGRGGHGHNDCLSFEAVLAGEKLISDCGAYLYTASYKERNLFRSTSFHNTPRIDGEEINRFVRPDYLWNLHYDAVPQLLQWNVNPKETRLHCAHQGYSRLPSPVKVSRSFRLFHGSCRVKIEDFFEGDGKHLIEIPLYLAPGVTVNMIEEKLVKLQTKNGKVFYLQWHGENYTLEARKGRVSHSYGCLTQVTCLLLSYKGQLPYSCTITLSQNAPTSL